MGRWAQRQRRGTSTAPAPPRVLSVTRTDGTHADWLFDQNVTLGGTTLQLRVNGNSPVGSVQQGPATIRNNYSSVILGQPWTLTATEPNLTPRPFTGQSGLVV